VRGAEVGGTLNGAACLHVQGVIASASQWHSMLHQCTSALTPSLTPLCPCAVHDALDPEYSILKQRIARRLRHEGATDESVKGLNLSELPGQPAACVNSWHGQLALQDIRYAQPASAFLPATWLTTLPL